VIADVNRKLACPALVRPARDRGPHRARLETASTPVPGRAYQAGARRRASRPPRSWSSCRAAMISARSPRPPTRREQDLSAA